MEDDRPPAAKFASPTGIHPMRLPLPTVSLLLRPLAVAGAGALLGIWVAQILDPHLALLAEAAGKYAQRAIEFQRLVIIGSITMLWYWAGSRLILRKTYREFDARVRTILPAKIAKRVPHWVL